MQYTRAKTIASIEFTCYIIYYIALPTYISLIIDRANVQVFKNNYKREKKNRLRRDARWNNIAKYDHLLCIDKIHYVSGATRCMIIAFIILLAQMHTHI